MYEKLYHSTDPKNLENIMKVGLRVNQSNGHTTAGKWADKIYGMRPIYVSTERGTYEGIPLEIDGTGLDLVADLPSLVDMGAYISDNMDGLWWEEGSEPEFLQEYLDEDGFIPFNLLIEPGGDATMAAIELTGTGAVLQDIPSSQIKP